MSTMPCRTVHGMVKSDLRIIFDYDTGGSPSCIGVTDGVRACTHFFSFTAREKGEKFRTPILEAKLRHCLHAKGNKLLDLHQNPVLSHAYVRVPYAAVSHLCNNKLRR
jgi:hypothetical protein